MFAFLKKKNVNVLFIAFDKDKPYGDLSNSIMLQFAICLFPVLHIISEIIQTL